MRILLTGGGGLLGQTLIGMAPAGYEIHATQRRRPVVGAEAHPVELSDAAAVERLVATLRPALLIHTAAAMTNGERDIVAATQSVVTSCARHGIPLIHMSTDALLGGDRAPYDDAAPAAPIHAYGRWKAAAEATVRNALPDAVIVRTSLITQMEPLDERSAWVADSLRRQQPITLFVDELRCPIFADDLAAQLWELASLPLGERAGMWNLVGPEAMSRYALGVLIAAHQRLDPAGITAGRSTDSATPRPRDLRLLTRRADAHLATRARPISAMAL